MVVVVVCGPRVLQHSEVPFDPKCRPKLRLPWLALERLRRRRRATSSSSSEINKENSVRCNKPIKREKKTLNSSGSWCCVSSLAPALVNENL